MCAFVNKPFEMVMKVHQDIVGTILRNRLVLFGKNIGREDSHINFRFQSQKITSNAIENEFSEGSNIFLIYDGISKTYF